MSPPAPDPASVPPVTLELAGRLECAYADGLEAVLAWASERNPGRGTEVHRLGSLRAFVMRGPPRSPWFNTIAGLNEAGLEQLDAALALYRSDGLAPRVEVPPAAMSPVVGRALAERGLHHSSFMAALYAPTRAERGADAPGVSVRELEPGADAESFARLHLAGFGVLAEGAVLDEAIERFSDPSLRRYVATVDGRPAAAGHLRVLPARGVALLGGTATLPPFRRRGAQVALVRRRLADAAAGADLALAGTVFGNDSGRNLQRLGFRLAHTKAIWTPLA